MIRLDNIVHKFILITSLFTINLFSQSLVGNILNVKKINDIYIFTDNNFSSIYSYKNNTLNKIIEGRGTGLYFTFNKSTSLLGYKQIDDNGLQTPFLYDFNLNEKIKLSPPVNKCGQVDINNNGTICFTIGNIAKVIFHDGSVIELNLNNYSNITRISNNNKTIAYNDNNDQIILIDILTGLKTQISDNLKGYFNPKFSNSGNYLLYQALNGEIYLYSFSTKKTINVGVGFAPEWANNSDKFIYYTKTIEKEELTNTDIYEYDCNNNIKTQLTSTNDILEIDPSYGENDEEIIYSLLSDNKIFVTKLINGETNVKELLELTENLAPTNFENLHLPASVYSLNIPYVHQVYDTPEWHNGHASCAPTTAIMLIAYYKILPYWKVVCSSPYSHVSNYGRYVSDRYRYRQIDYNYTAPDYGGNPAKGGFGFMWSSGSPYSKMADYYRYHGIAATQTEAPPHSEAYQEITNQYPYTMCVGLTTSGHLVLAHGLGNESHTLIVNDPYGNKNTPGYPSYDGQNARYDWPGYNNGYKNLNQVYWCIKTRYNFVPEISDTLVDDVNYYNGFYMHNAPPASMMSWNDRRLGGYKDHFWFLTSNNSLTNDIAYATWTPNLPKAGYYEVQAYIPYSTAKNAIYKINAADGLKIINFNQAQFNSTWASLGTFAFNAGNSGYVRLGDASDTADVQIVFDAVRWIYKDSVQVSVNQNLPLPKSFTVSNNYPNPFNPVTNINYSIPSNGHLNIRVFNQLGELIKVIKNDYIEPGFYTNQISLENNTSGIYFINFIFKDNTNNLISTKTIKVNLLK